MDKRSFVALFAGSSIDLSRHTNTINSSIYTCKLEDCCLRLEAESTVTFMPGLLRSVSWRWWRAYSHFHSAVNQFSQGACGVIHAITTRGSSLLHHVLQYLTNVGHVDAVPVRKVQSRLQPNKR